MSYDASQYSAEQQAVIAALANKVYGVPDNAVLTDYIPGLRVTAGMFNDRNAQVDAVVSYLEDVRRDEITRAQTAEAYLDDKFARLAAGLAPSPNWIMTMYEGNLTSTTLSFATGEAAIGGGYFPLPAPNTPITFTGGTPQCLVANDSGDLVIKPEAYSANIHEVVVGTWNGSAYTPAPVTIPRAGGTMNLTVDPEPAHAIFAGPTTGSPASPTFRALVIGDMPAAVARTDGDVALAGSLALSGTSPTLSRAAAAPTSGTHGQGDVVWATAPVEGDPLGWVCTAAGTPGTWVPVTFIPKVRTVGGSASMDNQDVILQVSASAPALITLPGSTWPTGKEVTVKDISGTATVNTITFAPGSGTSLGETPTIDADYGSKTFYMSGLVWRVR